MTQSRGRGRGPGTSVLPTGGRSRRRAALALAAVYLLYAGLFLPLTRTVGPPPTLLLAMALAIAAAWCGGCLWGTIAGLLTLPLNWMALWLAPPPEAFAAAPWSLNPSLMGISPRAFLLAVSFLLCLGVTGVAATIGRLRDLGTALRVERGEVETLLRDARGARDLLAEREALLGMALEVSSIGYWTYDPGSRGMTWSPGLCRILGEDPGGSPSVDQLRRHISPADGDRFDEAVQRMMIGESVANAEYCVTRLDGSTRWVYGGCVAMRDEAGRAARVIGILHDLTDHRRLQAQLARAERMAMVGQLAAGVAHRVNNPLAAVTTNLRCLERDLEEFAGSLSPETFAEIAATIQDAGQAAERVRLIVRELMVIGSGGPVPVMPA